MVSTAYDPMLGKVIAHGPDRESARRALVAALDETAILGLTTNAGFLRALVASDEFRDATIDTAWLDHARGAERPTTSCRARLAAWIVRDDRGRRPGHPFQADGFRLGGRPAPVVVELDRLVVVDRAAGTVDGVPFRQISAENHVLEAVVDGHRVRAVVNVQPHVVEVSTRASATCSPARTRWPARSRRRRHASPRRCPAPCSTSASAAGRPSRRVRCSACSRR